MEAVAEDLEESVDTLRPIYEAVEKQHRTVMQRRYMRASINRR